MPQRFLRSFLVNLARKDGEGGGEEWGPVGECEGEKEKCVVLV